MMKYTYKQPYKRYIFMIVAIIVGAIVCSNENLVASTSYYENWNILTPTTRTLENEEYYVKDNIEIQGKEGESGLVIKGDVSLYIAEGKTLSVKGGIGSDKQNASGAGIEVGEGATLRIYGKGSVRANGANGQILANVGQRDEERLSLSFGAGAGIGGKGGIVEKAESSTSNTTTTLLYPQSMGTLYIYDHVSILATGGQGEDAGAGTANIGRGGGSEEESLSRGSVYVAKSANVSDIKGTSDQAVKTAATWLDMSVINFDNQGGVGDTVTYGLAQTSLPSITTIPYKEGYQFLGYYSGVNATGVNYIDALGNHCDALWEPTSTTLYAAWRAKTYTLTLLQDGVERITVDGINVNANGTYTLTYGANVTVRAKTQTDKKFVGWYSDLATYTSRDASYTFQVPASDMKLHAIATNTGEETKEIKESDAKPRYAQANIQVEVDGIRKDMGTISLESEHGNILIPSGKNGNYTYTKTIDYDKERYEVRINGRKTGTYVSFEEEGTTNTTVYYHELNIHLTLNGKPADLGEIQLINKQDPNDQFQVFYNPNLGYAQYYALENRNAVYQIKVADQWMNEEIRLHEKQDIQLDFYRSSLDIQLDGIAKNMGEVTLRDEAGNIIHRLNRENGIYQKIARDTKEYEIYVNDNNTGKTMSFAKDEKLRYYTVSYEVTNPEVRGDIPTSQVYVEGSLVRVDANSNLSRIQHTLLGWRNERQLYVLGSEIEIHNTMQFYDTWQRNEESKQENLYFWVGEFGFTTLDEAVIATQMSNSNAFGKTEIEYRKVSSEIYHEIYGTLPNGYILKGNQEQLIIPKGKTLTLGDKNSKDDTDAIFQDMNVVVDDGQLDIDGQHVQLIGSKISLLPGNRVHLLSNLKTDSELKLECLDEIGKPAIMNESKNWKSDALLVDSDMQKNRPLGQITIENEGFSVIASSSNMGTRAYYAMDTKKVSAGTQRTLKDGRQVQTFYKTIQEAIDEENVGVKEIYVLKDSEENLTLHGMDTITLISAKQEMDMVLQPDNTSKILSGEMQIKDNRDGSGTLYYLQQMQIMKPIQFDANSKIAVSEKKTWLPEEKIILHATPTRDKEKRSMILNTQENESHFLLSNALLSQGYALYQEGEEMGMKYYGKAVDIHQQLNDITSEENETYTLQFDVAYETGISDDQSLNDAQYQELTYQWQRKQKGTTQWQDMDNAGSSVEYEKGIAHIRYTKQAKAENREYVYRCLVYNKVNKALHTYVTTREATIHILEEPSEFVKIPKQIIMRQERRETRGNVEVEELSTANEITLMGAADANIQYEVYTYPTFTLSQKNNVQGYTIHVWDEKKEPLAQNGLLMKLQATNKESGRFYLYGSSEESQRVGVYKGIMTFQMQRTQK